MRWEYGDVAGPQGDDGDAVTLSESARNQLRDPLAEPVGRRRLGRMGLVDGQIARHDFANPVHGRAGAHYEFSDPRLVPGVQRVPCRQRIGVEELVWARRHRGVERRDVNDRILAPRRAVQGFDVQDVDGSVWLVRAPIDSVGNCHVVVGNEPRYNMAP